MKVNLLPFYNERQAEIELIVLHSVAFEPEKAINVFIQHKVSSHYLIGSDGELWQLVEEKDRAWHAGNAKWRKFDTDLNSRSIGIELSNPSLGQTAYTLAQQTTLVELLQKLVKKYNIKQGNIVGHSDIAPARKPDPGKAFFWQELAREGIGLWYDLKDAANIDENDAQKLLETIGYDTTDLEAAAHAFCRRFLPEKVATIENVDELIASAARLDRAGLQEEKFVAVLKAVAYKYLSESNTPCKI